MEDTHKSKPEPEAAFNAAFGRDRQRSIKSMHDMSVRREALIKFYGRSIDYFKGDLLDRLLFIQCLAALDASEGHGLAGIYAEEFNRTLIQYQEAKEHGEI